MRVCVLWCACRGGVCGRRWPVPWSPSSPLCVICAISRTPSNSLGTQVQAVPGAIHMLLVHMCIHMHHVHKKTLRSLVLSLLCSPPHPQQPAARSNPQRGPTLLDSAMNSLLEETRMLHEEIDRTRCSPPPRVPNVNHFHGVACLWLLGHGRHC